MRVGVRVRVRARVRVRVRVRVRARVRVASPCHRAAGELAVPLRSGVPPTP